MRTRKARIDSASEAVRVMSAAAKKIVPPDNVPLQKCDLPFFASVIAEFARSEWTAHQLELAAMLARTMADSNREQLALRKEGSVAASERGTPVVNPRKAVVQMHAASILSFRRSCRYTRARKRGMQRCGVWCKRHWNVFAPTTGCGGRARAVPGKWEHNRHGRGGRVHTVGLKESRA
jgi:hypothetical protein